MSGCDKLKLKKMYGCDIDECEDYYETTECEMHRLKKECTDRRIRKNCKKTCNYCNVDECKDYSYLQEVRDTQTNLWPKC